MAQKVDGERCLEFSIGLNGDDDASPEGARTLVFDLSATSGLKSEQLVQVQKLFAISLLVMRLSFRCANVVCGLPLSRLPSRWVAEHSIADPQCETDQMATRMDRWRNFVKQQTEQKKGRSTSELGKQWRAMSKEEQDAYLVKSQVKPPKRSDCAPPMPASRTPFTLGDHLHAVKLSEMESLQAGAFASNSKMQICKAISVSALSVSSKCLRFRATRVSAFAHTCLTICVSAFAHNLCLRFRATRVSKCRRRARTPVTQV